jgi:LysR family transcriptional regulator, glycine cleavage system transcriptional activator
MSHDLEFSLYQRATGHSPAGGAERTPGAESRRSTFRRLPPLNALKSFAVAARHLSFTRAADELSVTPAAVGQQVRLLEDHLGVRLFARRARALELTEAGEACLPGIADAFERLAQAVARAKTSS